jgi:arsenite methyltransferase
LLEEWLGHSRLEGGGTARRSTTRNGGRIVIHRNILCALLLTLPLAACGGITKLDWMHPGRGMWQRPDDVVAALEIPTGAVVADLGAGEGYFVSYLADAVGDGGRVYAVEVDADRVDALQERFGGDARVRVVHGAYDDPKLPDGEIDLVLVVNTYHHIHDRPAYFRRLAADLSSGGRVAILEPNGALTGLLSLALDEGHTSIAWEVGAEMGEAGYGPPTSHDFLPVQIFEVFRPEPRATAAR